MAFATASPIHKSQSGRYRVFETECEVESPAKSRTFIVSNRLPFRVSDGKLLRGDGGLVSALLPVHRSGNCFWVGDGGFAELADPSIDEQMRQQRIIDVGLDRALSSAHYNGASNGAIWPLFHYFPAMCSFNPSDWEAYQQVCVTFANVLCEHAGPQDTVWVHDYQLMLLPQLLRERMPTLRIGYFHHIPFPAAEVLKIHPARDLLVQGLLGADVIGFHTLEYVRAFAGSVSRILGHEQAGEDLHVEDRVCRVGAFPLGIDCTSLVTSMNTTAHAEAMTILNDTFPPHLKVLLGVDRLDYTKGIPERLAAFEGLLRSHPELQGQVVLVMLCVPSRVNVGKYSDLRETIERAVGRINGELGKPGWVPVHYYFQTRPLPELTALYRRADVCIVSPLRDGLNLVCKEYCACHEQGTGVLVLSEFAGAAYEMSEALIVNPNDQAAMVSALYSAVTMESGERVERMQALNKRVMQADNLRWSQDFLSAVQEMADKNDRYRSRQLDVGVAKQLAMTSWTQADTGKKGQLVVIDVDLAPRNEFTARSRSSSSLLPLILSVPPAQLVLVTSACKADVEAAWPVARLPCWFIAERGALLRSPTGEWSTQAGSEPLGSFRAEVLRTLKSRASLVPESFVQEGQGCITWRVGKGTGLSLAAPIVLETCHALDQLLARSSYMCARTGMGLIVRQSQHTVAAALATLSTVHGLPHPSVVLTIGNKWSDMSMYEWNPTDVDGKAPVPGIGTGSLASFVAGQPPVSILPSEGQENKEGKTETAPLVPAAAPEGQVAANISIAVGSPISVARFVVPNLTHLSQVLPHLLRGQ